MDWEFIYLEKQIFERECEFSIKYCLCNVLFLLLSLSVLVYVVQIVWQYEVFTGAKNLWSVWYIFFI